MPSTQATELKQKNLALWAQMNALNKKTINDKGDKRAFTAEEQASWDRMDAEFEARVKEIDAEEKDFDRRQKHDQREADLRKLDTRRAGRDGDPVPEDLRGDRRHVITPESRARATRALIAFMSKHPSAWDDEVRAEVKRAQASLPKEARALSAITGAAGAFTIAQDFMPELDKAEKSFSGIMEACRVIQTEDGADLPWPKMTDVANTGHRLTENTAAAENVDPTFALVTLKAYVYTSDIILVPVPLLVDTEFDLEADLFESVAERIGRIFNTEATTGTGASQPRGLITALLADTTPIAAAAAGAIAYGDIVNLEHGVDPSYRSQAGAAFMFHDDILKVVKKIVDSNGRPLFMPADATPGTPATIMGRPYFINQAMDAAVATTNETMVFGLLKKYIVRKAGQPFLIRFGEKYMNALQVGFAAFQRLEGQLVSGGSTAVRVLQQP